jgi:hypothetical protein
MTDHIILLGDGRTPPIEVQFESSEAFGASFHFEQGQLVLDSATSPEAAAAVLEIFPGWVVDLVRTASLKEK